MNLSKYDTVAKADSGTFLHLEAPDRKSTPLMTETDPPRPIGITVLGRDSKKLRALEHTQNNRRTKNLRVRGGGRIEGVSSEDTEGDQLELAATACVKFHELEDENGQPLECTFENAKKLLTRWPWALRQVLARVNDESALLGE